MVEKVYACAWGKCVGACVRIDRDREKDGRD